VDTPGPLGAGHAAQLQAEFNVLRNRAPGHQQVFLQHEGHMRIGANHGLAIHRHLAGAGLSQA
jgi:hypothetical protein